MPDLTRWYKARLTDEETNIYSAVEELANLQGVTWVEPDYLRLPTGRPTCPLAPTLPTTKSA